MPCPHTCGHIVDPLLCMSCCRSLSCFCLIMHSLRLSARASLARQMVWHARKVHTHVHTLLNLSVLQRVNKPHKFLNFTELLRPANYVCVEMWAETGWVVPLSGARSVEKRLLFEAPSSPVPLSSSAAHTWGLCSSSGSSERPHSVSAIS